MPNLLSHLTEPRRKQWVSDLNYMNMSEIRRFCDTHAIPYRIWMQTGEGPRKTKETDRKPIVLARVRRYLKTGRVSEPTCLPAKVVAKTDLPTRFDPTDRLYYGWYKKKNPALMETLERLTDGRFKDGAVARVLIMEFWTDGKAPTLAAFAKAWLKASDEWDLLTPEYAYLTDLRQRTRGKNWKAVRRERARRALNILRTL